MKSILIKTGLLILFILQISITYSQNQIRFNHLTTNNGLSSNSVTCIFQDKKGFMWFGTQDGLNRFDGYHFKVFKNEPGNSASLTDNFIFSIYEKPNGNMFVETQSGNFHKYNPVEENFTLLSKDSIDLYNTKMSSVLAILHDKNNLVWKGGLSRPIGLSKENIKTGEKISYQNDPTDIKSLGDNKVYSILRDKTENLWIATFNGLDKFDEKTGEFKHYRNDPANKNSISDNFVWPIFQDARGNIWVGTVRGGLNKFNADDETFTNYKNDPSDPTSINDNFIFSIYQDRGGVIWIGTNNGGVSYFHPSLEKIKHYVKDESKKNSLSDNETVAITVLSDGSYWVGTRYGGLDKLNFNTGIFKNYSHNPQKNNTLIDNSVQTLYEDKSGLLWIGTFSSGLSSFDPQTEKFTNYVNSKTDPNSISDNRVYAVSEDNEGKIWIGTYGGGLNKFDKKTGEFTAYKFDPNDSTSLSSNSVWAVHEDKTGKLWVGTFGAGLNVFNRTSNKFIRYKNNANDPYSISDNNIINIFEDSRGNVWFATTGGLNKYISSSNSFKKYREKDGLANDMVFGILEDHNGYLWISTNNGLSKLDPVKETFKNYYYQDGLQSNGFNQNSFAFDKKSGRMLFGGPNGFNIFHPDSIRDNMYVPPVVLTEYLRYNTDDEEGRPIVEKGISDRNNLTLTYKDNIVLFDFSALSYHNNFMNQYKYKLEGFNENWIQLGELHNVTFTNLSPGDYTLRVIASNNDGIWNTEGASLDFTVTPPWWKTNIAYTFYWISFFAFLYGARKFDNHRREQKARMRESELRAKAAEAEKKVLQIENERKTKELEEARQLQLSMLPKEVPQLEHLDIAVFMRTATEVGGDYYDFIANDGMLNIAFGDATGHGLQAGTMVTLMKGFFTSYGANSDIRTFFERSTKTIKEIKMGRILMAFSFLKIEGLKMTLSSAGMPPVYYFNKSDEKFEELLARGMPLGGMSKIKMFDLIEKDLVPGDTFMLFSDGIPEQQNSDGEMYDYPKFQDKFVELVNKEPKEIVDSILDTIDNWRGEAVQEDDISLMVIRVK